MTDPIADMLTRIRNAQTSGKQEVVLPISKLKMQLAKILKKEGYIRDYITEGKDHRKAFKIILKSKTEGELRVKELMRISKPGRRVYKGYRRLIPVKSGMGITIISTPRGLMTNKEARKKKLGGEVICEVF